MGNENTASLRSEIQPLRPLKYHPCRRDRMGGFDERLEGIDAYGIMATEVVRIDKHQSLSVILTVNHFQELLDGFFIQMAPRINV